MQTLTTFLDSQQIRRRLALTDTIDHARRSASAAAAAGAGETDAHRLAMLADANRHLRAVIRELEALR